MTTEDIKTKMENIEDPELKKIIDDVNGFIFPKFKELQETLAKDKPGMFDMLRIAKKFTSELQSEYQDKFGRNFDEDMKKVNEFFGYSQSDMLNMLKNFK